MFEREFMPQSFCSPVPCGGSCAHHHTVAGQMEVFSQSSSPDLTRKVRQRVAPVRSCYQPSTHGWLVAQTLCKDSPCESFSKEKRPMMAGHGSLLCTQNSFNGTSLVSCGLPPGFPLFQMLLAPVEGVGDPTKGW